jgi:HlyD family secretion protein
VEEGSEVEAGAVLVRLDDTQPRATLNIVRAELDRQLLREARLAAERDEAGQIVLPDDLAGRRDDPNVASAFSSEQKLFEARRTTVNGERAQLREQVAQYDEQIKGLTAQQEAKESELVLLARELEGVKALFEKQLVTMERQTALERNRASLEGERGQIVAQIAAARGKISEIELQVLQLDKDFRTDVLKDLRDSEAKIAELQERQTAAEDQLRRIDIRAPQAGTVHELAVHTVGGVIGQGQTIMQIVPRADKLVIDAKIAPNDVDQVAVGSEVTIRILAGNQRTTPVVKGRVLLVSPDLMRDPVTNQTSYLARVAFAPEAFADLGALKVIPGMPAEVFINTGDRTPLEYLLQPVSEQVARTFRER